MSYLITHKKTYLFVILSILVIVSGCSLLTPMEKPDVGPAGAPVESKANPPFLQRFEAPPAEMYDLEATAGVIFEGIIEEDWPKVSEGILNLQMLWQKTKPLIGEKKGVKEADEALIKLTSSVSNSQIADSYKNLNKFMGSISDIAKSYKLSPLADIITLGNSVRTVSFFIEDNNWSKAASKAKELEDTWSQIKPGMEQIGILDEVTKTHSLVRQIKDAVNAENKGAFEQHIANINESIGRIRRFYRGT